MKRARFIAWVARPFVLFLLGETLTQAQVAGPNGHFYKVVIEPNLLWEDARFKAAQSTFKGLHGYLATITSPEEDAFIESLRQEASPGGYGSLWVGGSQLPGATLPTDSWFWVNGEGSIPTRAGGSGYSNWQPTEPNDYWGPQSEGYLSVGHFNGFGWNDEPNDRHIHGYVVEYPGGGISATVRIAATDPSAIEVGLGQNPLDIATFEFSRSGDLSLDLPVFFSIHGTAINGSDYNEISRSIMIPASASAILLNIVPRLDPLAVVEPMETVGVRLEPSLILTPSAAYNIDPNRREAAVVIYENRAPERGAIEIGVPGNGSTYNAGEPITLLAALYYPELIPSVDFYAGDVKIGAISQPAGTGGLNFFKFTWSNPPVGSHVLTARAITPGGELLTSSAVRITVQESLETPKVGIRFVEPGTGGPWPDTDFAPGYLEVSRSGSTAQNLQVFYSVSGTATADVDYEALQGYVVIGAGRATAKIAVIAKDDLLDEPNETVTLALVGVDPANPTDPPAYLIDPDHRDASIVILDNEPGTHPSITITAPQPQEYFNSGTDVRIEATATDPDGYMPTVEFFANETKIGESAIVFIQPPPPGTPIQHAFVWHEAPAGNYQLTARGKDADNSLIVSAPVPVHILDGPAMPFVRITASPAEISEQSPVAFVFPSKVTVSRVYGLEYPVRVYLKYEGTAARELDYAPAPTEVVIPAGNSSVEFLLNARMDNLVEGPEMVIVRVAPPLLVLNPDPANHLYEIDPEHRSVTLIIHDNDPGPTPATVRIEAVDPTATEFPPNADGFDPTRFYLSRVGNDWSQPLQVFLSLHGTARNGEDYETLPTSFTIPAGLGFVWIDLVPSGSGILNKYEIVSAPGLSWAEARRRAEEATFNGVHGHLATLTSAEEDAHVESLRVEAGGSVLWVGGYQEPGEPSITEGWKWVNNEGPIPGSNQGPRYANWLANEPNDYWGPSSENHIAIGWLNTFGWNDQGENVGAQGYVVEYPVLSGVPAEIMETVALRIEPSLNAGPTPTYEIDSHNRTAVAVIFEHRPPAAGAIEVGFPSANTLFPKRADVEFVVAGYHPTIDIVQVDFFVDGQKVGSSSTSGDNEDPEGGYERHRFVWAAATPGRHTLHALATVGGQTLSTTQIPFVVESDIGQIDTVVSVVAADPEATEFPPGAEGFNPARFLISRSGGDLTRSLQVFFSMHGTARNGDDYQRLPESVTIPAGEVRLVVQVVPLSNQDGDLLNHYEVVSAQGLNWDQARATAENSEFQGVKGHLATIKSFKEDQFIESLRQANGSGGAFWVGGYQEPGEQSRTAGWKWVNNEGPIPGSNDATHGGYANWLAGEPNDYWGPASENHMVIGWLNSFGWNDQGANIGAQGYVVEYEAVLGVPAQNEIMETVAIRLEASPVTSSYRIDPEQRMAAAVIFETQEPPDGAIEVAFPSAGHVFARRADAEFLVAAFHPSNLIGTVDFYVNGQKVGTSSLVLPPVAIGGVTRHPFKWTSATSGRHVLQARASSGGKVLVSSEIQFTVENDGANQSPTARVTEPHDGASYLEGQPVAFVVEASDPDGTISKIDLIRGDQVIASANGPSLHFTVENLPVGTHTFFARSFDNFDALGIAPAVRILIRHPDTVAFVDRHLPGSYSPGVAFTVELRANPSAGTHAYAVEDRPPNGWQVANVSDQGAFDSLTGKVKFGPFTDAAPRILSYQLTPPANASGHHDFAGNSSLNGATYPIAGDDGIDLVQQFHPADQNQGFSIVLGEMTSYAAAWKVGDSWPAGPVPIPIDYVTSAATIWKRGEVYRFDSTRVAPPACWVPKGESGQPVQIFDAQSTTNAHRSISGELRPGVASQVQITTTPAPGTTSYAIEEKPPRGWTVSNISHDGAFDAGTGAIRWGVFIGGMPRTLSYSVTPPAGVSSVGTFAGQFSFDGQLAQISSLTSFTINGAAPIQITYCRRTSAGMHLQVLGPAGQTAVIEASDDFVTWTELESIFIPGGAIEFTDGSMSATGQRFYRLRVQ